MDVTPPHHNVATRRFLARFPVTVVVFVIVGILGFWTSGSAARQAQLMRSLGVNWNDLVALRWHRLITALFVQTRPGLRGTIGLLLLVIPVAEWRLGPRRTAILFILGDWASTVSVLVGLRLAAALGHSDAMRLAMTRDGGTSAAVHALAAAAVVGVRNPCVRWLLAILMTVEVVGLLIFTHRLFDVQHAISALVGLGAGHLFLRSDRHRDGA